MQSYLLTISRNGQVHQFRAEQSGLDSDDAARRYLEAVFDNTGLRVVDARPLRTVEFLEASAKARPDRDVSHSGVVITWRSYAQEFMYNQSFIGGSLRRLDREQAAELLWANQVKVD